MLLKLLRFSNIYGFSRAFIKSCGRLRVPLNLSWVINPIYFVFKPQKKVGLIGAGQFAYATVSYFIVEQRLGQVYAVYDIDFKNAKTLSQMYGAIIKRTAYDVIEESDYIFILSNHFSHTDYAVSSLKAGRTVYCEKPISVNLQQLSELYAVARLHKEKFFTGYNRPHSPIIRYCKKEYSEILSVQPITLSCFVRGHMIPKDHWYRDPKEGTRICGNVGHWIDLFISLMWSRIELIEHFKIRVVYSSEDSRDDNCVVNMTTDKGDLFTVLMTSRCEPFEGIDERIELQSGELNVSVSDFRRAEVKYRHKFKVIKSYFKDVGHKATIRQPFDGRTREFLESFYSSYLTISIADLVVDGGEELVINKHELKEFFK